MAASRPSGVVKVMEGSKNESGSGSKNSLEQPADNDRLVQMSMVRNILFDAGVIFIYILLVKRMRLYQLNMFWAMAVKIDPDLLCGLFRDPSIPTPVHRKPHYAHWHTVCRCSLTTSRNSCGVRCMIKRCYPNVQRTCPSPRALKYSVGWQSSGAHIRWMDFPVSSISLYRNWYDLQ